MLNHGGSVGRRLAFALSASMPSRSPHTPFEPGTAVSERRCTSMVRWMLMLALLLAGCAVTETQDRPPLQVAPSAQDSPLARMTLI